MDSKVISICLPRSMLNHVNEFAALEYQTRSSFIRTAIVEYIESLEKQKLADHRAYSMHAQRQLLKIYDFEEEFDDTMSDQ